jgi:hypothetical protein
VFGEAKILIHKKKLESFILKALHLVKLISKMKRIIYSLVILLGLQFASCGKYEDGPAFSLRTKTARLAGEWTIEKITIDGEDFTAFVAAFITSTEFTKDGDYIVKGTDWDGTVYEDKAKWAFSDDKSEVIITDTDGSKSNLEILRLTNSEFWAKEVDTDGSVTEVHYKAK